MLLKRGDALLELSKDGSDGCLVFALFALLLSKLGIDCYIKMKNLNKRLYQGARTQHCLWLTGSSTSGAHRRLPAGRRVDCTAAGACMRQAVAL